MLSPLFALAQKYSGTIEKQKVYLLIYLLLLLFLVF